MFVRCAVLWIGILPALTLAGPTPPPVETASATTPDPRFAFTFRYQPRRLVTTVMKQDQACIRIARPDFEEHLEITLQEGRWPDQVVIQLESRYLDELFVYTGKVWLNVNQGLPRDVETFAFDRYGKSVENAPGDYSFTLRNLPQQKLIEIVLPANLRPANARSLKLGWITRFN